MKFVKSIICIVVFLAILSEGLTKLNIRRKIKTGIVMNVALMAHGTAYDANDQATIFSSLSIIERDKGFRVTLGMLNDFPKYLIVMFRGTDPSLWSNIKADLTASAMTYGQSTCKECNVHKGFNDAYMSLKVDLTTKIKEISTEHKDLTNIIYTGHSLGGAMANFGAYNYLNRRASKQEGWYIPKVSLITFGAPRVGNKGFADFMNTPGMLFNNYRIIYKKDPVTGVPFKSWGFVHSGTEIRYNDYVKPVLGKKLQDTCDDASIFSGSDHLEYKNIDPIALWTFLDKSDSK